MTESRTGYNTLALLVAGTFFMENLDGTVIVPAVPAMAASFATQPVDLNVGVSAYLLTLGVFIPISGWMAERFGSRRVFGCAIALFTLASLLCGSVQSLPQFVIARVLQGIGGAMMVPVGRLVVLRQTPKDRLIHVIATLTWPALVAPVLGPPLGGLIVDHTTWRWIFWLNLPLGLIAFILAWRLVPETETHDDKKFDWPGFLMIGAALFAVMLAAEILSRPDASWVIAVVALVIGVVLIVIGARHLRNTPTPMVDLDALKVPTFAVTIWGGSLFRMGISALPFLLPLMFQLTFGYDAFSAGLMLMAIFAGNLVMKPMTTPIIQRFGFRPILVTNGLINACTIASCAIFTATMPVWLICSILFVAGMSRSMQFTALNTIAYSDISPSGMASANTLFSTAFQLAMGLGIAVGAVAWRLGEAVAGEGHPAMAFRIAYLAVAATAVLATFDSIRLDPHAGRAVSAKKPG